MSATAPTRPRIRLAITASTAGSVLSACLGHGFFRDRVAVVLCDRPCAAADADRAAGVATEVRESRTTEEFSERLAASLPAYRVDYLFSFSTRFYPEWFRRQWTDRIVNFHPLAAPGFPGQ